jgi:hypothetical protein
MRIASLFGATAVAAAIAVAAPAWAQKADKKAAGDKPAAAAAPATISSQAEAKWTDTTNAAAATPENKAVLAGGKPMTVTGEVIDVSCYLQLGKKGDKHIPCGTKCLQNGQPIGVLDEKGDVYVLFAEEHDPRRDGQLDLKATFIPLLAKKVTVSGMMTESKGTKALFVHAGSLKGGAAAPAASPASGAPKK